MTTTEKLLLSAQDCLKWIEKNLLPEDGRGIYERIRTNRKETVRLCRPDTAAEFLTVLYLYEDIVPGSPFSKFIPSETEWLIGAQLSDRRHCGAFPFYYFGKERSPFIWQNDNGKVLIHLLLLYKNTGDERLLSAAKKCAEFWLKRQRWRGNYYGNVLRLNKRYSFGPCFLLWLMAGMAMMGTVTGEKKYTASAYRAFRLLRSQTKNGRLLTSYERANTEAWRPVSSENFIALLCYSIAFLETGDTSFKKEIDTILPFCESLLTKGGAIRNGTAQTAKSSENNSPSICDCVYTLGYGLNALISLYEVFGEEKFLLSAKKAANFALETQCKENDATTDGGWRGSYNIDTKNAEGQCNQNNSLDEGGKYSLYAGWCALPIAAGLLRLCKILAKNDRGDDL